MGIPKLLDDLAYISKLGNNPGSDNGLTPSEFRAKFDAAALAIQTHLNMVIDEVNRVFGNDASAYLLKTGGKMAGDIDMDGKKLTGLNAPTADNEAANKKYVDDANGESKSYADTRVATNLLDNSDFLHFVAKAGTGGAHGTQAYAGDRWILDSGTVTGAANETGGGYTNITLNGTIRQVVADPPTGDCVCGVEMVSGTANISYANGEVTITSSGGVIKSAGLYTGKILPKYVPKGYAAELLECQRYYQRITADIRLRAVSVSANAIDFCYVFPVVMRIIPTLTLNECRIRNISGSELSGFTFSVLGVSDNRALIRAAKTSHGQADGTLLLNSINTYSELSADL